ncbi:Hypothetical protein NTJ_13724 [Nesidiocoris tenuis]|nr:Hypothetical protein NTJ_13724 [Nesidiocoris tenuis]
MTEQRAARVDLRRSTPARLCADGFNGPPPHDRGRRGRTRPPACLREKERQTCFLSPPRRKRSFSNVPLGPPGRQLPSERSAMSSTHCGPTSRT